MTWSIQLPHHGDRSAPLIDVANAARALTTDDDRVVTRQIVLDWSTDGVATVGDALDRLEAMTPAERRALLDAARKACGLESTDTIDARRRVQGTEDGFRRVSVNPALQCCHSKGCDAFPSTPEGTWRTVNVRRWFCDKHRHQADPGDMTDLGTGLRYSENGVIVPDTGEAEREAAAIESRRAQQASKDADRAVDAAAYAEHRQARREQLRAELPDHLKETAA